MLNSYILLIYNYTCFVASTFSRQYPNCLQFYFLTITGVSYRDRLSHSLSWRHNLHWLPVPLFPASCQTMLSPMHSSVFYNISTHSENDSCLYTETAPSQKDTGNTPLPTRNRFSMWHLSVAYKFWAFRGVNIHGLIMIYIHPSNGGNIPRVPEYAKA